MYFQVQCIIYELIVKTLSRKTVSNLNREFSKSLINFGRCTTISDKHKILPPSQRRNFVGKIPTDVGIRRRTNDRVLHRIQCSADNEEPTTDPAKPQLPITENSTKK